MCGIPMTRVRLARGLRVHRLIRPFILATPRAQASFFVEAF
jgi:hypothetical protein